MRSLIKATAVYLNQHLHLRYRRKLIYVSNAADDHANTI